MTGTPGVERDWKTHSACVCSQHLSVACIHLPHFLSSLQWQRTQLQAVGSLTSHWLFDISHPEVAGMMQLIFLREGLVGGRSLYTPCEPTALFPGQHTVTPGARLVCALPVAASLGWEPLQNLPAPALLSKKPKAG